MSLVTRCPHCATAFKVVADQLRVRNGLVRCGVCNTVFDGRACLVTPGEPDGAHRPPLPVVEQAVALPVWPAPVEPEPEPATRAATTVESRLAAAPVEPAAVVEPPAVLRTRQAMREAEPAQVPWHDDDVEPGQADDTGDDAAEDEPGQTPQADGWRHALRGERRETTSQGWALSAEPQVWRRVPREPGLGAEAAESLHDEPALDNEQEPSIPGERRTRYSSATGSGRTPPEFLDDDRQRARGVGRRIWALACLLAALALGLQLLYVQRSSVASAVPWLRPVLEVACKPLGCTVGYGRRLERIAITSSSLRTPQGASSSASEGRSLMVLNVVMRNRYDKPQPWPALVLELTDISDTVVARKVLMPQDYLDSAQAAGPFAAGAEVTLAVPIEIQGINVNGYQLDKFFP
ncbi:DUF3426 domain-containing protein [Bordetella holmesii]|uniref:PF11906 family protein n=2 Tax=Bordetella holmesii TaxID=35814 RepID=A0A158M871_9BORD|nr:DUF3426 domain-containing protein [Bordetella holmesii]AHV91067.1 MJ0042 family finger-like domain protein [Bordetella holmesii ATCC 51541]EWM43178.1 MJ0042 family finger-like domain protein [Bordetella holmesii 41130]AMD45614.1 hypothetical protein H558_08965 [Bordetella holmesii H558]AMD48959.1 hypothetical protein F783_009125 [Bordetella holmesii F627]AOB34499.1 hypothetical protein BBB42_02720 [Bordetella holmesii]